LARTEIGTYFYFWRSSLTLKALSMTSNRNRAVAAAMGAAAALGLTVDDAIVLQESNKLAVRPLPCDVLARVAEERIKRWAEFEVELALRLAETGSPVAALEPRVAPVYVRDGFVVTLWTYYEPVPSQEFAPADYAHALERLHDCMRQIDFPTPHFTDRITDPNCLSEAATRLQSSLTRTVSFSATRYEVCVRRSALAGAPNNSCTGSHTRATCSGRRRAYCSWTSRPVAAGPSSSISPTCPKR